MTPLHCWVVCVRFFLLNSFFVVEDTVLHTSQSLVSQKASSSTGEGREEGLSTTKTVHEFWQMALAEVLAVLRNNCVCAHACMQ